MSSPSNKPYQSRLFNFINRHYIKFNSQINVKFRELRYVATTGLQTLIFPFFWLWENTKKINNTFSASSSSVSSFLKDSSSQKKLLSGDDVIINVNEAINLHPQLTSFPLKNFQGFASRINDKHIICILDNNKFIDVIPLNKQEEVSNIIHNITDKLTNIQLLPPTSPSNFFSRFLHWFNLSGKSKIDINISQNINHLQESDLVIKNESPSTLFLSQRSQIILFIDSCFAMLENITFLRNPIDNDENNLDSQSKITNGKNQDNNMTNYSQTLNPEDKEKLWIFMLIQEAINYFFKKGNNQASLTKNNSNINDKLSSKDNNKLSLPEENITNNNAIQNIIIQAQDNLENIIPFVKNTSEQIISQGFTQLNITKNNLQNKLNNPDDPFQVKILIWAAIDYFFNHKNKPKNLSSNSSFSETEILVINEEVADPWLLWEDLYGYNALPYSSINDHNSLTINQGEENIELAVLDVEIDYKKNNTIVETKSNLNNIIIQEEEEKKEIDVNVIEIKYEKHLLEIILEKLDQIILWLEEILVTIINRIKLLTQK
ncbi:hypothetical protein [Geminocystis sp.]|uniref:hypothetical protein n=1 Tax=Geminocystis sp. TaxID=2664100 RepID=UPI0035931240